MIRLQRTDSSNQDFIELVRLLDAELAERDGEDHAFYDQFNSIDALKYAVVAYDDGEIVGCGAIKPHHTDTMEVKRMFVPKPKRGRGIASLILSDLELWASELGYSYCNLETGKRQPEAIALYEGQGYQRIKNYGQYAGIDNSVCFQKLLPKNST